jgi:hypothetical protein
VVTKDPSICGKLLYYWSENISLMSVDLNCLYLLVLCLHLCRIVCRNSDRCSRQRQKTLPSSEDNSANLAVTSQTMASESKRSGSEQSARDAASPLKWLGCGLLSSVEKEVR